MAIHYTRPEISGGLHDPFDCDEQVVTTLVTVGAFVALSDGYIDKVERDETVNYIDRRGLAPTISRQRIAEFFDARARHLEDGDFRANAMNADDWRLERLINRLPRRISSSIRFVRQPSCRWLRIPVGLLLTVGGVLWFLPIAGLWMLPAGLALLADDVRLMRSLRSRALDWVEHHRPHWLADGSRPQ
jgi:hypothetical protein